MVKLLSFNNILRNPYKTSKVFYSWEKCTPTKEEKCPIHKESIDMDDKECLPFSDQGWYWKQTVSVFEQRRRNKCVEEHGLDACLTTANFTTCSTKKTYPLAPINDKKFPGCPITPQK